MASPPVVRPLLLGLALLALGELLHLIGQATPEWSTTPSSSAGLWSACTKFYLCSRHAGKNIPLAVCRACSCIGLLCGLLAGVLGLGYLIRIVMKKSIPRLAIGTAVAGNVAVALLLACIIVWAATIHGTDAKFGYSFALSITGCILLALGTNIILLVSWQKG